MNDALPIPPERLLEETRWLRSLALCLAGPGDADDIAQATWLRAIERGPSQIRGLRPWLRTVLRHAFQRKLRDQASRTRREAVAANPEALPSAAAMAAKASLHRAVVDEVLSLDEPWRSTVLLRFFEDRKPQEIARLQNIAVATVHTRLRRAFAILRARLDRDHSGRRDWVSLVVPIGPGGAASVAPAVPVGVAMSIKTIAAAALGIILIIVASWLWFRSDSVDRARTEPSANASTAPASAALEARSEPPSSQPESALSQTSMVSGGQASAPASIVARVQVSDDEGRAVAGAVVMAAPSSGAAATNALGEAVISLTEPCLATIKTSATGFADALLESVPVTDGARIQVDLLPLTTLTIRITDAEGAGVPGATVAISSGTLFVPERAARGYSAYENHVQQTDADGIAKFAVPAREWALQVHATGFVDPTPPRGSRLQLSAGPADTTIVLQRGSVLRIRFEDSATGVPVPGVEARIAADTRRPVMETMTESDDHGIISIGRAPDATSTVKVGGSFVAESSSLSIPPDQVEVVVRVSESRPIGCRVTREDGTLVTEAILEYAWPRRRVPMFAQDDLFQVEGQGVGNASHFRFVVPDFGGTAWVRRTSPGRPRMDLVAYPAVRVAGQVVDTAGQPVRGALIRSDPVPPSSTVWGMTGPHVPPVEMTTTSDGEGRFRATVGGDDLYLLQVATVAGPCARHLLIMGRGEPVGIPYTRVDRSRGTCDVGRIVAPTATGELRVLVSSMPNGGGEVIATPAGSLTNTFPPRRATIRMNRRAEIIDLPEGDYDVTVVRGRGFPVVSSPFGLSGARVHVTAREVTDLSIAK